MALHQRQRLVAVFQSIDRSRVRAAHAPLSRDAATSARRRSPARGCAVRRTSSAGLRALDRSGVDRVCPRRGRREWRSIRRDTSIRQLQHRHMAAGFFFQKFGVRFSPLKISVSTQPIANVEAREQHAHLVAIAGACHRIGVYIASPLQGPRLCRKGGHAWPARCRICDTWQVLKKVPS